MGRREVSAVRVPVEVSSSSRISSGNLHHNHVADWMIEDDEEEEDEEDEDDNVEKLQDSIRIDEDSICTLKIAEKVILSPLVDYTEMASHVWIDGIRDPTTGRYLTGHTPFLFLTKRASGRNTGGSASVSLSGTDEEVLVMGGRSQGSLEMMVADGLVLLQPAATRLPSIKKEKVEDVPKIQYTSPIIRERVSASLLSISSTVSVSESYPVIDEVDDDDDFFGSSTITVPRVRPQKSLIPVAQVAPSELQTQTAPSVVRIPESDAWALPPSEPLSAVEIEDKRKSKKHKSVSVQARLAERQRYLSEAQQRRANATSDAARSKEEQTKQYQLKKSSSPLTSASSSVPLSSGVFTGGSGKGSGSDSDSDRKNEYSLRTARTSVAGEIIRIVPTVEAEPTVQEDDDDDSDGLWA